jgi:hypothetical protein
MTEEHIVTNATLYSLLQMVYGLLQKMFSLENTIHANQTEIIIPDLAALDGTALRMDLDSKFAALDAKIAMVDANLAVIDTILTAMEAKLDQISAQVTPPETGDFNP